MNAQPQDQPTKLSQEWHPFYWQADKHGTAWDRVKEALKRDWGQTKADLRAGGEDLNQQVTDTVKQALGTEQIPAAGAPNPTVAATRIIWTDVEPAVRYGFGAHEQYAATFEKWDDKLEFKLASEWDEKTTGKAFSEVRPFVQHGWDATPAPTTKSTQGSNR